jgi:hypothetical protein
VCQRTGKSSGAERRQLRVCRRTPPAGVRQRRAADALHRRRLRQAPAGARGFCAAWTRRRSSARQRLRGVRPPSCQSSKQRINVIGNVPSEMTGNVSRVQIHFSEIFKFLPTSAGTSLTDVVRRNGRGGVADRGALRRAPGADDHRDCCARCQVYVPARG